MKKNRMMRLASLLLICVLLTTSVISGTFAKYVSNVEVEDEARVAYWGFGKAPAITFDLFDGQYVDATNGLTVKSEDGDNIVAPGTKKESKFGFAYTDNVNDAIEAPEVAYTFVVDAEITGEYDALDDNENFFWTLDGKQYETVAKLLEAIEGLDGNKSENRYEPGQLPAAFGVGSEHTIGWEWVFSTDSDHDAVDTEMGNADPLANVAITISITAEQID